MSSADDQYEQKNDVAGGEVPAGDPVDNDYKSRTGQYQIPVQSDTAPVADPIDPATADSDETLGMHNLLHHQPLPAYYIRYIAVILTFVQPRMTPMPSTRATLLGDAPGVQSLLAGTRSQVMRRVYHLQMGPRPLAESYF